MSRASREIAAMATESAEGEKLALELIEMESQRAPHEKQPIFAMQIESIKTMARVARWGKRIVKQADEEDARRKDDAKAAACEMAQLFELINGELESFLFRHPWLESKEEELTALIKRILFGTSDRQPAGIAAQLTDKEQERIGPEALQRMADVFNGPEAER